MTMHPSTKRARDLIDSIETVEDDLAVTRSVDHDGADPLQRWDAMRLENISGHQKYFRSSERTDTEEAQADLAAFIDARIAAALDTVVAVIGEECGRQERRLKAKIRRLEVEIGTLRADVHLTQSVAAGEIKALKVKRG